MSQFKVYAEGYNSVAFDTVEEAKEWAHECNANVWFEIVDLTTAEVIYTAEDWDFSNYAGATA